MCYGRSTQTLSLDICKYFWDKDILVKFEGNVKYENLVIPEEEDSIPDDLCRSVCSKSESKASPLTR